MGNEEKFIYKGEPPAARYSTPDDNWSELIVGEGSRFMPPELDLSQTDSWFREFMNNWFDNINGVKFNVLGVDFTLHSTFEDAKAGENPWLYCNYNDGYVGFPRDCGPTGWQGGQWNSYIRGGARADHHGWFVEVPNN